MGEGLRWGSPKLSLYKGQVREVHRTGTRAVRWVSCTASRAEPTTLRCGRTPAAPYPLRATCRVLRLSAALTGELVGNVVASNLGARQVDPGETLRALNHGAPCKGLEAETGDEVV